MRKRAIAEELAGGWEGLRRHPITGTALGIGSFVPVAGGVISAGDMLQNLYRGNLTSAGLNAVGVGAGMLPGGKVLTSLAAKGGRIGQMAAKAAPYVAPIPGHMPNIPQIFSTSLASTAAGMADQSQQMNRPIYRKQMREQEKMMREFNEWQKHKATLQALGQQPQVKESQAPSTADMARKLWDITYGTSPYLTAGVMGGHMLPSYYKDDVPGMARGALTGGGATAGTIGGVMGGGLVGSSIGRLLAARYGIDPSRAAYAGAGVGSILGGLGGHEAGRHVVSSLMGNEEENPRQLKFSSDRIKSSAWAPSFSADPVGYAGHQAGRLGGAISGGVGQAGQKVTGWGDPRTGKIIGNLASFLGKYPKSVGTAAVAIPSLLAMRAMTRGSSQPTAPTMEEKQAAKNPQQRAKLEGKRRLEQEGRVRSTAKPPSAKIDLPKPEPGYERLGDFSKRKVPEAATPLTAPALVPEPSIAPPASLASVLEWRVPQERAVQAARTRLFGAPIAAVKPPAVSSVLAPSPVLESPASLPTVEPPPPVPVPGAAAPGAFAQLKAHPMVNRMGSFAASPKGQAAILGTLALGGAGAYWAGRGKRKKEDVQADQEMAQAG